MHLPSLPGRPTVDDVVPVARNTPLPRTQPSHQAHSPLPASCSPHPLRPAQQPTLPFPSLSPMTPTLPRPRARLSRCLVLQEDDLERAAQFETCGKKKRKGKGVLVGPPLGRAMTLRCPREPRTVSRPARPSSRPLNTHTLTPSASPHLPSPNPLTSRSNSSPAWSPSPPSPAVRTSSPSRAPGRRRCPQAPDRCASAPSLRA